MKFSLGGQMDTMEKLRAALQHMAIVASPAPTTTMSVADFISSMP